MKDYWKTIKRLLKEYLKTIERLLEDYWKTIERLLKNFWKTIERPLGLVSDIVHLHSVIVSMTMKTHIPSMTVDAMIVEEGVLVKSWSFVFMIIFWIMTVCCREQVQNQEKTENLWFFGVTLWKKKIFFTSQTRIYLLHGFPVELSQNTL